MELDSWGRNVTVRQDLLPALRPGEPLPKPAAGKTLLAFGKGRSYGDCCLNDGNMLLPTEALREPFELDEHSGVIQCGAGVTLGEILELAIPRGWCLSVVPGTRHVTVGGAIANDVHGKNHHRHGSFGHHVLRFELLRTDGTRRICSPETENSWFGATIGGLGLTGVVSWAEIQLMRVPGPALLQETHRFETLTDYFQLWRESQQTFEYTVAWMDALSYPRRLGRGLFHRANSIEGPSRAQQRIHSAPPLPLLTRPLVRAYNAWHFRAAPKKSQVDFRRFFFPLDRVRNWNRLYGKAGLVQYHCVLPPGDAQAAVSEILMRVGRYSPGSFLCVLKAFGNRPSRGLLSFPREGFTLALDFANRREELRSLLDDLDRIVWNSAGAIYPAKDTMMNREMFQRSFPNHQEFRSYRDPGISSSFWRRVE